MRNRLWRVIVAHVLAWVAASMSAQTAGTIPKYVAGGTADSVIKQDANGQIGIGVGTVGKKLDVFGAIRANPDLYLTAVTAGHGIFVDDGANTTLFTLTRRSGGTNGNTAEFESFGDISFTSGSQNTENVRFSGGGWAEFRRVGKLLYVNPNYNGESHFGYLGMSDGNNMGLALSSSDLHPEYFTIDTGGHIGLGVPVTSTSAALLDVRKPIITDAVSNLLMLGFSGSQANRSVSVQQIGTATTSNQYLFLNGGLGASSTAATQSFTSTYAPTFGFESNDAGMSLVTAATGTNITPIRALTVNSQGHIGIGGATPSSTYAVDITGSLRATDVIGASFQDVAEWVPAGEELTPGMVVVLNHKHNNEVIESRDAYDTAVAGVVSEHPGVVLGNGGPDKAQIATTGRVKVRVDARKNPIEIGDLLVTSDVAGTAMKSEPMEINGRRFHQPGTIVGKALEPLASGTGEILVLLSLQ